MAPRAEINKSYLEKLFSVSGGAGLVMILTGLGILAQANTLPLSAVGLGVGFMAIGFLLIKHQSLTKDADKYFRK